jgi:hypothetical protein
VPRPQFFRESDFSETTIIVVSVVSRVDALTCAQSVSPVFEISFHVVLGKIEGRAAVRDHRLRITELTARHALPTHQLDALLGIVLANQNFGHRTSEPVFSACRFAACSRPNRSLFKYAAINSESLIPASVSRSAPFP